MTADNLLTLDLARFSRRDLDKIAALSGKLALMHRWYRTERRSVAGSEQVAIFSGDRSSTPYAGYRITRLEDGAYRLSDYRTGRVLATARAIDAVLEAIPGDFYHSGPGRRR